ncbi:MAG: 50S ribosomal protein L9 [Rickettsiales bacterium]|nr:50S ribosomal protein L9 [Rickettsiales bacterium]
MQVVLLERIERLGQMGDVVKVKPGYARNFLLPQKKALRATKSNLEHFEGQRQQLEADNLKRRDEAQSIAGRLDGLGVIVIRSAGESGQLYGSVNARDIAEVVIEAGFTITRDQVIVDRPTKTLGFHEFRIRLHPEVEATVIANVARSGEEAEIQAKLGRAIVGDNEDEQQVVDTDEAASNATELLETAAVEPIEDSIETDTVAVATKEDADSVGKNDEEEKLE